MKASSPSSSFVLILTAPRVTPGRRHAPGRPLTSSSQTKMPSPQRASRASPPGTANMPLPMCSMYSFRASCEPSWFRSWLNWLGADDERR